MIPSPYNLNVSHHPYSNSTFYSELNDFTNQVIETWQPLFNNVISEFKATSKLNAKDTSEYLAELLIIGVLYQNYKPNFSQKAAWFRPVFDTLYQNRKRVPKFKAHFDALRGKLAQVVLMPQYNLHIPVNKRFNMLLNWLICSKEYNQETERLQQWKVFVEQSPKPFQEMFWDNVLEFARWFSIEASRKLGKYTLNWDNFRTETALIYKNREDAIFCKRPPNEYYMNMVAAEIMNRALRANFLKTNKKILLLPTCMAQNTNCKAKLVDGHLKCQQCSSQCNVNNISLRMSKHGVGTVLIPHSSSFSEYLKPWQNQSHTGLIGVACVLNLLTGGYEMQKLNIPSQCVFLDSSGCKKHWLSDKPTNLNINQLETIIRNEPVKQPVNSFS